MFPHHTIRDLGLQSRLATSGAGALTPWLKGWDPTLTMRSRDRRGLYEVGWDFYNILEWKVRMDVATEYMEMEKVWYCDDRNADTP